jgi:hypothetical protein
MKGLEYNNWDEMLIKICIKKSKYLLIVINIVSLRTNISLASISNVNCLLQQISTYLNIVSVTHISSQLLYSKPFIHDAGSCAFLKQTSASLISLVWHPSAINEIQNRDYDWLYIVIMRAIFIKEISI